MDTVLSYSRDLPCCGPEYFIRSFVSPSQTMCRVPTGLGPPR